MKRPDLTDALCERLLAADVNHLHLAAAAAACPETRWKRLPLRTNQLLDDTTPLQPALDVALSNTDIETFLGIYEEFVAGYILSGELKARAPMTYLTEALNLTPLDAAHLFSDGQSRPGRRSARPGHLLLLVVALAELARQNYPVKMVQHDPDSYVVIVSTNGVFVSFGISRGRPVTNLKVKPQRRLAQVRNRQGLVWAGREQSVAIERTNHSAFAQILQLPNVVPAVLGGMSLSAWEMMVGILRWRCRGQVSTKIQAAIAAPPDGASCRQALRLASGFVNFDRPHQDLMRLLVPLCVSREKFYDLFGYAPRGALKPERVQQWRIALDTISDNLKDLP